MEIRDMGPGDGPDGFEYEVNKEKKTARIGIKQGLVTNWSDDLTKDQLTAVLWHYARARRQLEEGEDVPPPEEQIAHVVEDPRWFSAAVPDKGGSLLIFNHPYFGALGFVTPFKWAATLMRLLAQQIEVFVQSSTEKADQKDGAER